MSSKCSTTSPKNISLPIPLSARHCDPTQPLWHHDLFLSSVGLQKAHQTEQPFDDRLNNPTRVILQILIPLDRSPKQQRTGQSPTHRHGFHRSSHDGGAQAAVWFYLGRRRLLHRPGAAAVLGARYVIFHRNTYHETHSLTVSSPYLQYRRIPASSRPEPRQHPGYSRAPCHSTCTCCTCIFRSRPRPRCRPSTCCCSYYACRKRYISRSGYSKHGPTAPGPQGCQYWGEA